MSRATSTWRPFIEEVLANVWPDKARDLAAWIEAQVEQESGGNPNAVSPSGAQGLLQLMPATGKEVGLRDPFLPYQNLHAGVTYLKRQYDALPGLPERAGVRLLWATAAYNGGMGYVRKALSLAKADGQPDWPLWSIGRYYLMHRDCSVGSLRKRWPDYRQIWGYVEGIRRKELAILSETSGAVPLAGGMR